MTLSIRHINPTTEATLRRVSLRAICLVGLIFLLLLSALAGGTAAEADDRYLKIYSLIEAADSLSQSNAEEAARTKYVEAHTALRALKADYPKWNTRVVTYRLNYVAGRITALSQPAPTPSALVETAENPPRNSAMSAATAATNLKVKLLDAGVEPRRMLRLQPHAGDKQTCDLTLKTAVDMDAGAMPGQSIAAPAVILTLETVVKSISAEGDIVCEMAVRDATIGDVGAAPPKVAEALKGSIGTIRGYSATGTFTSRGLRKGTQKRHSPGAARESRQFTEQVEEWWFNATVSLPEEPVGPGAKWEVAQQIKSQGVAMHQTLTYELITVEEDQVSARSTVVQRADRQTIQNPSMPGLKMNVSKFTGTGDGSVTFDLGRLLPSLTILDVHTEMTLEMNVGGQPQAMTMKSDVNFRLEEK